MHTSNSTNPTIPDSSSKVPALSSKEVVRMRSKKVSDVIVVLFVWFVMFVGASASARSLNAMGGQVWFLRTGLRHARDAIVSL